MRTSWQSLLRWSAIAVAVLLAIAAAALRDVEAGAFAIGTVVALALTRWRKGLLGTLGLGLLAADVAVWMGPGAYSNLTHGEGMWETFLPSALTVAAVMTVVSAVGDLLSRRAGRPVAGARQAQVAGIVLFIAADVLSVLGLGDRDRVERGDIEVVTEDVRFSDETLEAASGEIGLFVSNKDLFWHTFTIAKLDVNVTVPVGAERRTTFTANPGTYRFVCAIPGHTQAGMEGVLTVE